jgi:hypothetical protein
VAAVIGLIAGYTPAQWTVIRAAQRRSGAVRVARSDVPVELLEPRPRTDATHVSGVSVQALDSIEDGHVLAEVFVEDAR